VDGASKALFVLGLTVGGLVAGFGYVGVAGSYLGGQPFDWNNNGNRALLVVAGIGALVAGGGGLLVHANAQTRVTQHLDPGQGGLLPLDSWTRTPTWSNAAMEPKMLPPATGVPIFSCRF
jgi:hypothetical protein